MTVATLSSHLEDFLTMKRVRAAGDARSGPGRRQLKYTERLLRSFVDFWQARGGPCPIRPALVLDWVAVGTRVDHPYRDQHRVWTIRSFLTYVRAFAPDTEIPPNIFRPGRRRRPHVFSGEELRRLMQAPYHLRAVESFRPLTLATLIGLLASTGVRIGEALRLRDADAELAADPPHVRILDTKFGKSRLVVLHPSTADHLRTYLVTRTAALHGRIAEAFFTTPSGQRLNYLSTSVTFRRLLRHAGIQATPGQRAPTLHSLRHTFAVNRLTQWHRERRDVHVWLPHLSVYLGHLAPANTYWYITGTPALLQSAAGRLTAAGQDGGAQ
jgi:integrase